MNIHHIRIQNFRVYEGEHKITFAADEVRNVHLICGNNGYGKTTFLTAMVWCLYGKQMQEVDDSYKEQIFEAGGYRRFLEKSLNRNVASTDDCEPRFAVEIGFKDVAIPSFTCEEIVVKRSYLKGKSQDNLEILIDGQKNELTVEVGPEYFINDFILPKEIAKFFFFDAEKIVSLAEIRSLEDKRKLSRAYSEVLGIKKYETLKNNLKDMRLRFRKDSASKSEREKFAHLNEEIEQFERLISYNDEKSITLEDRKASVSQDIDQLQERLIREGSNLSLSELKALRQKKLDAQEENALIRQKMKDMLLLAPFAIAWDTMTEVESQNGQEQAARVAELDQTIFESRERKFLALISENLGPEIGERLDIISQMLRSSFLESGFATEDKQSALMIHNFSESDRLKFRDVMHVLRNSFRPTFKNLTRNLRLNKSKLSTLTRQLSDAESKEKDEIIQRYREDRQRAIQQRDELDRELIELAQESGRAKAELKAKKRVYEELGRRIRVGDLYQKKDQVAERLIGELDVFLSAFKNEKKQSLETRILHSLKQLMHKQSFIERVEVEVAHEIIDIRLFDANEQEIPKDTLSKGEQQLYATAILKALVEESNIRFPVMIDSPMQKFDGIHARNIISEFYPTISKQVILFPLLIKELSESEYHAIQPRVRSAHLIVHLGKDSSGFKKVAVDRLFDEHRSNQINVFERQNV